MNTRTSSRKRGFALIEALIALLLIAVGLVAVSKLQSLSLFGSGEARMRTEAANFAHQQLEELRNVLRSPDFTGLAARTEANALVKSGTSATFKVFWSITNPTAGLDQRLVQVTTKWTNARGVEETLQLNSLLAWDDPIMPASVVGSVPNNLISPTGEAQRGSGTVPSGLTPVANADGTKTYTDAGGKTYLVDPFSDNVILTLPPKKIGDTMQAQKFTTITGRIYFHVTGTGQGTTPVPNLDQVQARLSSEGECFAHRNSNKSLIVTDVTDGSNKYKYFTYTCYVGPGWYGNVGIDVLEVNGQGQEPKICVGDPNFNSGDSNGELVSAHSTESALRSYRGFSALPATNVVPLSTGVAGGTTYGATYILTTTSKPGAGLPRPSEFTYYTSSETSGTKNYFNQHFLLVNKLVSCRAAMAGTQFRMNAGRYVCINPDLPNGESAPCPRTWPNFEGQVGTGGATNWNLRVRTNGGSGTGNVIADDGGINCGQAWTGDPQNQVCGASYAGAQTVRLLPLPSGDAVFAAWDSGCTSIDSNNICTVTTNLDTLVVARFNNGPSTTAYPLTVGMNGSGQGRVTSSPGGIDCWPGQSAVCGANYASGTTVILTAAANTGTNASVSWSGCVSVSGNFCTVTMSQARHVRATFVATTGNSCTTATVVSGAVYSSTGGIAAFVGGTAISGNPCKLEAQKVNNYSCSFAQGQTYPAPGLWYRLRNQDTQAGNTVFTVNLRIRTNCSTQTNANFPGLWPNN